MAPAITEHTTFRRSNRGLSAVVGGETVILDQRDGAYYSVSNVGAFVWDALAAPMSLGDLARAVSTEYEVDPARCREDLLRFLDAMLGAGLMETGGPDGA